MVFLISDGNKFSERALDVQLRCMPSLSAGANYLEIPSPRLCVRVVEEIFAVEARDDRSASVSGY